MTENPTLLVNSYELLLQKIMRGALLLFVAIVCLGVGRWTATGWPPVIQSVPAPPLLTVSKPIERSTPSQPVAIEYGPVEYDIRTRPSFPKHYPTQLKPLTVRWGDGEREAAVTNWDLFLPLWSKAKLHRIILWGFARGFPKLPAELEITDSKQLARFETAFQDPSKFWRVNGIANHFYGGPGWPYDGQIGVIIVEHGPITDSIDRITEYPAGTVIFSVTKSGFLAGGGNCGSQYYSWLLAKVLDDFLAEHAGIRIEKQTFEILSGEDSQKSALEMYEGLEK